MPRKPAKTIQKTAPGAADPDRDRDARDVAETDRGGEGRGQRLEVRDGARLRRAGCSGRGRSRPRGGRRGS